MEDKENIENQEMMSSMFDDNNIDDGLGDFDFGENISNENIETETKIEAETNADINSTTEDEIEEIIEDNIEVSKELEEKTEAKETTDNLAEENVLEEISETKEAQIPTKKQNFVSTSDDFEQDFQQSEELITVRPIKFQEFDDVQPNRAIKKNLDILQDISMHISVELGRTKSTIKEVMELEKGSVVELDKIAGEQVEVFVNEKLVAKGEVIVIEDKFGVRVTSTNIVKNIQ